MSILCPHCQAPIEPTATGECVCPACGSGVLPPRGESTVELPDTWRLGRFEILVPLGSGAFGTVYKARDPELDRTVALKVPRADRVGTGEHRDRFLREARSAAQLRHPAIVPVHEVGQIDGQPYLVSEFVAGVTLADRLTAEPPPPHEAAWLVAEVAEALHYAHERGVVHRDVKPSNILLDEQGRPHVMDFGLAKRDAGEVTVTLDGQVLGTPAYMSPEQARGEAHRVDGRSDVYSLGVILYQLLTGERPFRGNARMLLYQVLHDEPKPPRRLNDRVPRDLETVCLKAMAKAPAHRYQTAAALAEDLHRFLDGRPIQARPAGRLERAWRWCRRHPARAGLVAALVGLLLAVAVGAVIAVAAGQIAEARDEAVAARKRADEARAKEEAARRGEERARQREEAARRVEEAMRRAGQRLLAESYLDKGMALVEAGDVAGSLPWLSAALKVEPANPYSHLHRTRLAAVLRQIPPLIHIFAPDEVVMFSPNGVQLLAVRGAEIRLLDPASGAALAPPLRHPAPVRVAEYNPDGRRLVTAAGQTVWLWEAATGQSVGRPVQAAAAVTSVTFSRDGGRFLTLTEPFAGAAGEARVWDAATCRPLTPALTLPGRPPLQASLSPDGLRVTLASGPVVQTWDAGTGKPLAAPVTLKLDRLFTGFQLALSPDGRHILERLPGRQLRVWDTATGRARDLPLELGGRGWARFSPDGGRVLTYRGTPVLPPQHYLRLPSGEAQVWDAATGKPLTPPLKHYGEVRQATFSPDGRRVVTASADRTARVWDAATGQPLTPPLPHSRPVLDAVFSPDGRRVATVAQSFPNPDLPGASSEVRVWDAVTGGPLTPPLHHDQKPTQVRMSPDGRFLAAWVGGRCYLWDTAGGRGYISLGQAQSPGLPQAALSPDGRCLATLDRLRRLRVWEIPSGKLLLPPTPEAGNPGLVGFLHYSPDGRRLLTGGDRQVRLWDAATGRPLGPSLVHDGPVNFATFSPDGRHVLTGSGSLGDPKARGAARVWDAFTGKPVTPPLSHDTGVVHGAFSPDGRRFVTASGSVFSPSGTLRVWDTLTGRPLTPPLYHDFRPYKGPRGGVQFVAFSPDGRRVISVNFHQVQVWDAAGGQPLGPPLVVRDSEIGHRGAVLSPDGRRILLGHTAPRLWDLATGQPTAPPLAVESYGTYAAFSFDARLIVTTGRDRIARVWEAATAQPVTPPLRHGGEITYAAFTPDGRRLVTTEATGSVRIWDLRPSELPLSDLVRLAELLSARKLDATGASVPRAVDPKEWQDLRTRYPELFAPAPPAAARAGAREN